MKDNWRCLRLISWIYDLKDKITQWRERKRYEKIKKEKKKKSSKKPR